VRLIDYFREMIAYGMLIRRGTDEIPSYEQVRQDMDKFLARGEKTALKAGIAPKDFDDARFAVCAFVDEFIMLSEWAEHDQWELQTLQRRYYNTANAGEGFFQRLESLPDQDIAVREVYAICLALGFRGKFFHDSQLKDLKMIKEANFGRLWAAEPHIDQYIVFPEAYFMEFSSAPGRNWIWGRYNPTSVFLVLFPPAFLITLYAVYQFWLNRTIYSFFVNP
jgi:type VI secretion system protein ImpK